MYEMKTLETPWLEDLLIARISITKHVVEKKKTYLGTLNLDIRMRYVANTVYGVHMVI